jgi:hypothetical protein
MGSPCSCLGECDGSGDLGSNLGFHADQLFRMNHVISLQPLPKARDRLLVPPSVDLGPVAIELGIEHRMRTQSISPAFKEIGIATLAHRMHGSARGGLDGDDVHAIYGLGSHPIACGLTLDVNF